LAFLIAFVLLVVEIWTDRIKFLNYLKRPIPKGAENIGSWYTIMQIVSYLSIVVNVGLFAYTSGSLDFFIMDFIVDRTLESEEQLQEYEDARLLLFAVFLIGLVLIKKICASVIPDVPRAT
jgi:Calcium-activated chloride channel